VAVKWISSGSMEVVPLVRQVKSECMSCQYYDRW
jgi:hypothetical protein